MPTTMPANAPSSPTTSSNPDGADFEPDVEWKVQLRKRIEEGLQSMVADAKENRAAELRKSPDTPETRLHIEVGYKQAMKTIKSLATEQYQLELDRERNQRRWTAGVPMNLGWTQYFIEEQQNVMNSIKQSSNQTDNSARTVSESLTDKRRSVLSKPSNEPSALTPLPDLLSVPHNASPQPTAQELQKSLTSRQSLHLGSDSYEDEAKLRALEARRQKLEESRREVDDELKRTEVEIQWFAVEARKKRCEEEVRRKEEEAKRKEEEAARKEEEAKKKEEEAKRKEQDAKKEEETAKWEGEEARRKAELSRREGETRQRAATLEDIRTKQMQLEAQKIAQDALKKQEDLKRMEEEARKNYMEMKEREDVLRRREEELMRREADSFRREVEARQKEETARKAEFRKREDDIRCTREEREHNDSVDNHNAWPNPFSLSVFPGLPGTSPDISRAPQLHGTSIPETNAPIWDAGPAPARGRSIKPTASYSVVAVCSSDTASTGSGSIGTGTYSSEHSSESDRTRGRRTLRQREQFRRTQEKLEAEKQLKSAEVSREHLQRVFEYHEVLWNRLNTLSELSWKDFPWPMAKPPSNPDDISLPVINAYILSPVYPDKNKSQTTKDRINKHIKGWHPERFETNLLPKVVENEREKVKHGARNVAMYLSDLLAAQQENDLKRAKDAWSEAQEKFVKIRLRQNILRWLGPQIGSGDEMKTMRIQDLEAEIQKLEEDKKEAEHELDRTETEFQRLVERGGKERRCRRN